MEQIHKAKVVIFDKTGTITEGKPKVTNIEIFNDKYSENQLLRIAGSIEQTSNHPLSKAIVEKMNSKNITGDLSIKKSKTFNGKGIIAFLDDGRMVSIGNDKLMKVYQTDVSKFSDKVKMSSLSGNTTLYYSIDEEIVALINVADTIKKEAKRQSKSSKLLV